MIKKKPSAALKKETGVKTQVPARRKKRRPVSGPLVALRILGIGLVLVVLGCIGGGGYYVYDQYRAMGNEVATVQQDLAAMRLERARLHAAMAELEQSQTRSDQRSTDRLNAVDHALDRLEARINPMQRVEAFIYLAERERLISRSPRRVIQLLVQARADLRASPRHTELLAALNRDLVTYERLRDESAPILYELRVLSNYTATLRFTPSFTPARTESRPSPQNWWRQLLALLSDHVRIHRYDADATDRLGLVLDDETLNLVRLVLEAYLVEARNALLTGDEKMYRAALNNYVVKLRHYYPPGRERLQLEDQALRLAQAMFPHLPALSVVQILPRYR